MSEEVSRVMDKAQIAAALLVRLAEREAPLDGETLECQLCDQEIPYTFSTWEPRPRASGAIGAGDIMRGELALDNRAHTSECPWREARELLGVPLNRVEARERERLSIPAEMTEWEFPP